MVAGNPPPAGSYSSVFVRNGLSATPRSEYYRLWHFGIRPEHTSWVNGVNLALGNAIARLRESVGISQEELAERAGIHRTYVSQLERGLKSLK